MDKRRAAGYMGRAFFGIGPLAFAILAILAVFMTRDLLPALPVMPSRVSDSPSYLNFAGHRPHGYSWFLWLHQYVFGGLQYLPRLQALLFAGSMLFLSIAVSLRLGTTLAGIVFLKLAFEVPDVPFEDVMSDAVYVAFVAVGMGALILLCGQARRRWMVAGSLALGLAAATRTVGYLPLALFAIAWALIVWRLRPGRRGEGLALALAPAGLILALAATSNLAANGRFAIGSWGGMSLLGKGLLVATPLPPGDPLSLLNWTAPAAREARIGLHRAPNPVLEMLVARQYYEHLRWFYFWGRADIAWPAWRETGDYGKGQLAGRLAKAYIVRQPAAFAELAALDYASLWVVPRMLTAREANRLQSQYREMGEVPFLTRFEKTQKGQLEYFSVVPTPEPRRSVYLVRATSLSFLIASLALLFYCLSWPRARQMFQHYPDLLVLVVTVHATYALTALLEGGLDRYVAPMWPLMAASLMLMIGSVAKRVGSISRYSFRGIDA